MRVNDENSAIEGVHDIKIPVNHPSAVSCARQDGYSLFGEDV